MVKNNKAHLALASAISGIYASVIPASPVIPDLIRDPSPSRHGLIHLLLLILISISLRLINLGYSDYQGDEIKALFLPEAHQSFQNFILDQRKGPLQFVVTYLIKLADPLYSNHFFDRLPFALAGILSVILFYLFVKKHFGDKVAFYSAFFFSVNGFMIAFSRIIQYQSFVIFFMLAALYLFTLAVREERWKYVGVYLGFISWTLSILAHYDGVFIFPMVVYLFLEWKKKYGLTRSEFFRVLPAGLLFIISLLAFYIPFALTLSEATKSYWLGRLNGVGGGKVSSSIYLFRVYQPIYVIHIYTVLGVVGAVCSLLSEKFRSKTAPFMLWFLFPAIFMEVLVNIPGTHIFTYLVPVTVLMGVGVLFLEGLYDRLFKSLSSLNYLKYFCVSIIFLFMFLQSYFIYVDNKVEYPWTSEKFLIWEFHRPTPMFHLSMFGFPYYRHWAEISKYVKDTPNNGFYSTKERSSLVRYYIPLEKEGNKAGFYIYLLDPQSFAQEIGSDKARYWSEKYAPIKTFSNGDLTVAKIYYMQEGPLEDIR